MTGTRASRAVSDSQALSSSHSPVGNVQSPASASSSSRHGGGAQTKSFLSGRTRTAYARLADSQSDREIESGAQQTPRHNRASAPSASLPVASTDADTYVDSLAYGSDDDGARYSDESEALFLRRIILALVVLLVGVLVAFIVRVVHEGNQTNFVTRFADTVWMNPDSEMSFLQISDIHYDAFYNDSVPVEALCRSELLGNSSLDAGLSRFGRQRCDPPLTLLRTVLARAHTVNPNPPFILLTGDLVAHQMERMGIVQSNGTQFFLQATEAVLKEIAMTFPGVPVLPAFGNNDGPVHNGEPLEDGPFIRNLSELYTNAMQADKLVQCDLSMLEHALFYQCEVTPKLFVISINTMLWYERSTVSDEIKRLSDLEFEWLEKTLDDIFTADFSRRAIIIAHVPPALSTFGGDSALEKEHIARLARTLTEHRRWIVAAFLAHFHTDELQLLFSENDSGERIAVVPMYMNPSVSPVHGDTNPGFREYSIRHSDLKLMNYRQHSLDLDKLNLLDRFDLLPRASMGESPGQDFSDLGLWSSYHFRGEYQDNNATSSLSRMDVADAMTRIAKSRILSEKYNARRQGGYISLDARLQFTACAFFNASSAEEYTRCRTNDANVIVNL